MGMKPGFVRLAMAFTLLALATSLSGRPADESETLTHTEEITIQKQCAFNKSEYAVTFKVRMHFVNRAKRKLIVSQRIGKGECDAIVAADTKHFIDKEYERYLIVDRDGFFADADGKPIADEDLRQALQASPEPNFAVLAPGESLERECECQVRGFDVLSSREGSHHIDGLHPGNHVLAFWVPSWPYYTKPEAIHQRWEPLGHLVSNPFLIGPLPFSLPPIQKIEKCD